jgi:hypothetical protein
MSGMYVCGGIRYSDRLGAGWPGFDSRQCKIFLFTTASRPTLGPTQPPSLGVKWQGCEAEHSPPSSGEVKKGAAIPSLPHTSSWHSAQLIKYRDNFAFNACVWQCFMLVSCLVYSCILKMKSICSSKTLVNFRWIALHYIPHHTFYNLYV